MRLRSLAAGLALVTSATVIATTTQHFAAADVSSGDRPVLVPITPCRLTDTRAAPNTVGPRSSPLGAADTHTVDAQEAGTPCSGLIPADASALSLNVTALGATAQSFLTMWAGGERPLAASLNPAPGEPPIPNAVTTELSVDQEFEIYNNAGNVNVVVDVNGYYVNHNHDDRYYTQAEVDAALSSSIAAALASQPWSESMPVSSAYWFDGTGPTWTTASGGSDAPTGLTLEPSGFTTFWHGFTLPPNYTAGTDIKIRISWMADTDNAVGCTFRLFSADSNARRPGQPVIRLSPRFVDGNPTVPTSTSHATILTATNEGSASSFSDNLVQSADLRVSGADLLPGDQISLRFGRANTDPTDTCTAGLTLLGLAAEPE